MASAEPSIPVRQSDKPSAQPAAASTSSLVPPIFAGDRLTSKNVWVAGLLALFLGPPGMIYSTPIGTLVMSMVSVPVWIFGGVWLGLLDWVVCIVWSVMAARD